MADQGVLPRAKNKDKPEQSEGWERQANKKDQQKEGDGRGTMAGVEKGSTGVSVFHT